MATKPNTMNLAIDILEQTLAEISILIQANMTPVNVIVPKETREQKAINISMPPIVVNVPKQERPTITVKSAPITVNANKGEKPIINVELPKQKVPRVAREQEVINRDAKGQMTGTQSIQEFEYEE